VLAASPSTAPDCLSRQSLRLAAGAYANANAVRWTSSTTNRTAIWRTDDTSTSIHTFNLDHIDTGAGVNILTATSKVNGTISGYGQAYTTHYSTATIGMWKALADSNVTAQKTAYIWMYATGGSPFAQAQFGTGTAPSGTPDTPGTLTAGIDVTSSATISIIGTSKLLCASDSTTYTQTNGTLVTGNNVDTLGLSGNSAAVNLNFYLNAVADRKATIQAFNGGTNGGRLTIYTKADGSASMAANTTFNEAGDISVTRNASIGGYVNPTNLTVGRAGQGGTSGSTYSIYWTGAVAQLWIDSTNVGNITLTSDRRIKRNITPLPSTLSSIMQLNPVSFFWNSDNPIEDKRQQVGLIAQEVGQIFPMLVTQMTTMKSTLASDGLYRLDYIGLIPLMIKALQEMQKQINSLVPAPIV
jgi:hypothetical protein